MNSPPTAWDHQQWRVAGNWEPKSFLLRRGDSAFCDIDALWEDIHSEAYIRRLRDLNINVVHIHFHKGFGLHHDAERIEEAVDFARRLRAAGIRVGTYIGCTLFYETWPAGDLGQMTMEHPCDGWSGAQYFRRYWCWNKPAAMHYFKKVIDVALDRIQADHLHFDSGFAMPHHQLCHCEHCLARFHQFVHEKLRSIAAATGLANAGELSPPPPGRFEALRSLQQIKEPGEVAWTLFHAQSGYRALYELSAYARKRAPEVKILYNGANLCGITAFSRPNHELEAMSLVDATVVEDDLENPVGVAENGVVVSRFRPYKVGQRRGTRVLCYTATRQRDTKLMLAESAAFNHRCIGIYELSMQGAFCRIRNSEERRFLDWIVAHEPLFLDRRPWSQVAVLRHHESMILNPATAALCPYVVEQVLFESHASFAIIGADEIDSSKLREFNLLILPNTRCLSDEQADQLERFVAAGGALLCVGECGTADLNNRHRSRWALGRIFARDTAPMLDAGSQEITAGAEVASRENSGAGRVITASYGNGMATWMPALKSPRMPTDSRKFAGYDWYYHPAWKLPPDQSDLIACLDALLGDRAAVATNLPPHIGVEYYSIDTGIQLCFVNYQHPRPTAADAWIRIRPPHPHSGWNIRWLSPEGAHPVQPGGNDVRWLEIPIPSFNELGILLIEPEGSTPMAESQDTRPG